MSIPVIGFFNNKGGVGKTTMVYHLAWMFAERGVRVLAADLDPQSNLTAACMEETRLEKLLFDEGEQRSIFRSLGPLMRGIGDIETPHVEPLSDNLGLILGDMSLSKFEDQLSEVWPKCLGGDERAFRVTSAFYRAVQSAGEAWSADAILIDLGPNLGAINRSALIASDHFAIPLGPDMFSIQGLQNLGPALRTWRLEWRKRLEENVTPDLLLPTGDIKPLGYMVLRHAVRLDRPVKAFERWIARIPSTYQHAVLDEEADMRRTVDSDPNCIAKLKDYRSLMPLAQEARKPVFLLKPADGALGAHTYAVSNAYEDFRSLAGKISKAAGIESFS